MDLGGPSEEQIPMSTSKAIQLTWNVGLLGAGYIASHHARALKSMPQIKIVALCDINSHQTKSLKKLVGDVAVYENLDAMLDKEKLDVIHILLPPDLHYPTAERILNSGKHIFLEKPMCTTSEECRRLAELAQRKNLKIGINHNFMFFEVYEELKKALKNKELGPLDHVTITWHKSLEPLHGGPYDIWMLRSPRNLMLEIGPHLASCLLDLIGPPDFFKTEASNPILLPNKAKIYRRWCSLGYANNMCCEIRISLCDGFDEHTIEVRGQIGSAKVDFEKNIFILNRHTDLPRPFDLYTIAKNEAQQINHHAKATLRQYLLSKLGQSKKGDPYFGSILASIHSFYTHLESTLDERQHPSFAAEVIGLCEKMAEAVKEGDQPKEAAKSKESSPTAEILVIGSTGFIGRTLVQQLIHNGQKVRLLVRHPESVEHSICAYEGVEIIRGDLRNRSEVKKALEGIKTVYHLARAHVNNWNDYLEQEIKATRDLAEECLNAKVQRLIYTGTIDSYYAGEKGSVITEATPLDPHIESRNYYAKAKAEEEGLLMDLHRQKNLPVVILRPGIVLGMNSDPFHWGVGMWHYRTVCQLWGKGDNFLPFVLVEDVAKALIAAKDIPALEGQTFNLVDLPCLSGQDYAIHLSQALQARLEIKPTSIWKFYLYDCCKWIVKLLIRHPERKRPTYRDWASRTQYARYDSTKAQEILKWKPAGDRQKLIDEGIYKPAKEWTK